MIQINIDTSNGRKTIYVPSSWKEVTVNQYLTMEGSASELELLSVLSGEDLSMLENTRTDLTPALKAVYKFLNDERPNFPTRRTAVRISNKLVKPPSSFPNTFYGQRILAAQLLTNNNPADVIADIFALYLQPEIDGHFDSKRLPFIKKMVLDLPIYQVQPWCAFFLRKSRQTRRRLLLESIGFHKLLSNVNGALDTILLLIGYLGILASLLRLIA